MECHVCLEAFDAVERRPKFLPCGHTFCLRCLQGVQSKCPLDSNVFESPPHELPDNFMVLQLATSPAQPASLRLWCRACNKVAVQRCGDEDHALCSQKKGRLEDTEPLLESLRMGQAGLAKLAEALDEGALGEDAKACRAQLQQAKDALAAASGRLQGAVGADAAVWEQAKLAAEQDGLSRLAAQLAADLADPSATCSVTVRRGAAGDVAWRGEVRPAEDAAARLLLCGLACRGDLQPEQLEGEQRPATPRWQERPNEGDCTLTVEEMAAKMRVGSRVARGRDWEKTWIRPGPGTVTRVDQKGFVHVEWDFRPGTTDQFYMGYNGMYRVRLLFGPLEPCLKAPAKHLDATTSNSDAAIANLFKGNTLEEVGCVVGLNCAESPVGSLFLLQNVAPHLEGLQMQEPKQQHLDAVLAMSRLQALGLTDVTAEQLQQVVQLESLRRLELHCRLDAPLPVLELPATGLQWLRCGVYPLAAALAVARANADSLEELQLVAASEQPYGCPDLGAELRRCGLKKLRRLVLLRGNAYGDFCRHDEASCKRQMVGLWHSLVDGEIFATVECSDCKHELNFMEFPASK